MKSKILEDLAWALRRSFPQVGPRQSERMALKLLSLEDDEFYHLTQIMQEARRRIFRCEICQDLTQTKCCSICADARRNPSVICVVENPQDVGAIEASRSFQGLYHVLHGSLEPKMETGWGGPSALTLSELGLRLKRESVEEVILALDYDTRGEITALYLARELARDHPALKVTRIGAGLPFGGEVLYSDAATLGQSLSARREIGKEEIGISGRQDSNL